MNTKLLPYSYSYLSESPKQGTGREKIYGKQIASWKDFLSVWSTLSQLYTQLLYVCFL